MADASRPFAARRLSARQPGAWRILAPLQRHRRGGGDGIGPDAGGFRCDARRRGDDLSASSRPNSRSSGPTGRFRPDASRRSIAPTISITASRWSNASGSRRRDPGLRRCATYLTGKPFEAWSQGAAQFAALETLEPKSHKPYLRAHLYPARFVYSFMTGRMGSNDAAVEWLQRPRAAGARRGADCAKRSTAAALPPIRTCCFPRAQGCRARSRPAPR